ncbi:DUF1622 domain-containing protein [Adhaeribacter sp. BT258]|uniref:DUF1622 domain-containing protein n=1 Tax=Adhaeribacter terrigena TaxID=2793070 RepID=A0ABS1BY00_9BACT|nr:DUF1622 domain-containing protein [Adhaeribacter terrigena]MBK0402026.1 DUF1622 domain-containing protein [Adhaeribacter terrigena]
MEEFIKMITIYLARFVEAGAALIIGFATLKAFYLYLRDLFLNKTPFIPRSGIRHNLGRSLALALEFLLGADILQTAVAPTWDDIGKLAAIAVLRTGLNYFLELEMKEEKANPMRLNDLNRTGLS